MVAAVWLPKRFNVTGIDDSKKLTPAQREAAETRILSRSRYFVEFSFVEEIDRLNVLHATMAAMARAVVALGPPEMDALVDGNRMPPGIRGEAVVGGDGLVACIAAASILAKTARDRYMSALAGRYPEYGFERHFGYATPEHLDALRRHGPCEIHRRSFAPVRDWEQRCLVFEA